MPSGQDSNATVNYDDITLKPVCQMSTNAARRVLFLRLAENVSRAGDGSEDASGTHATRQGLHTNSSIGPCEYAKGTPGLVSCSPNQYACECDKKCDEHQTCSGHGRCNAVPLTSPDCWCDTGWSGAACSKFMFAAAEFVAIVNFLGSSFVHPWAPSAFMEPAEMFAAKYRVEIPTRFATDATHFVAHGRSFLAVAAWNEVDSTRDAGSQIFALTRTSNPLAPWNATSVLVRVSLIQTLPEVTTARQVLYFEVPGTHTPLALVRMLSRTRSSTML